MSCDPGRGTASGSAIANGYFEVPGVLRVSGATSSVTTRLDDALGIVTTVATEVKAVSIAGGQIELGDVRAEASTSARGLPAGPVAGRPASPGAVGAYRSEVGRMTIGGHTECQPCDPAQVARAINDLPEANVQAVVPRLDTDVLHGTPGGYEAIVRRDRWEQLNDEVMNELSAYDQEVPALRLVVQEDAYQHSALFVDLAAPQAEAHRGVQSCSWCALASGSVSSSSSGGGSGSGGLASANSGLKLPGLGGAGSQALGAGGANGDGAGSGPAQTPPSTGQDSGSLSGGPVEIPSSFGPASQPAPASSGSAPSSRSSAAPANPVAAVTGAVARNAAQTARGLEAVATSPQRLAKVLLVWALLATPIYLSSRRRLIRSSQRTV
ncbi:MAG: hypothetical protein LC792_07575 [Actinobacteria bacterium]|nr:hypothetical protein [Actinomycetota bacterium]